MDYEKLLYYSGNNLEIPRHPSKDSLLDNTMQQEEYLDKLDEYKILVSKYRQNMSQYKDEIEKRQSEFLKELARENNISYQKAKKLYNQCIINNSTNNIFEIYKYFKELVEIHKVLNNK